MLVIFHQERQRRIQTEHDAADEIERLRREIEALRRGGAVRTTPIFSSFIYGSIVVRSLLVIKHSNLSDISL